MGQKRFYKRQNFSLFLVKFKKLGFSAPLNSWKIKLFLSFYDSGNAVYNFELPFARSDMQDLDQITCMLRGGQPPD